MKIPRYVYLILAIVGTIVPWFFFGRYAIEVGGLGAMLADWTANDAVRGITADISIAIIAFWVWMTADALKHKVRHWWVVFPANLLVGLSLALPLYLWMRAGAVEP